MLIISIIIVIIIINIFLTIIFHIIIIIIIIIIITKLKLCTSRLSRNSFIHFIMTFILMFNNIIIIVAINVWLILNINLLLFKFFIY